MGSRKGTMKDNPEQRVKRHATVDVKCNSLLLTGSEISEVEKRIARELLDDPTLDAILELCKVRTPHPHVV